MNVSGITPSAGIYTYNSIRLSELRSEQIAVSKASHMVEEISEEDIINRLQEQESIQAAQTYTSYDYAKEYRPGQEYSLVGVDADIHKLDVERAISDMEKDKVLQQYQYFVGDAVHKAAALHQEAALRSGENFIL